MKGSRTALLGCFDDLSHMEIIGLNTGKISVSSNQNQAVNGTTHHEQPSTSHSAKDREAPISSTSNSITSNETKLKILFSDMLKNAGLSVTSENIKMLEELFKNQMALSKEMVMKLNQAVKMMGGDIQKGLFFLNNEMPITTSNVNMLKKLMSHDVKFFNLIENLMQAVSDMPEGQQKQELLNLLAGYGQSEETAISTTDALESTMEVDDIIVKNNDVAIQGKTEMETEIGAKIEAEIEAEIKTLDKHNQNTKSLDNLIKSMNTTHVTTTNSENTQNIQQIKEIIVNTAKALTESEFMANMTKIEELMSKLHPQQKDFIFDIIKNIDKNIFQQNASETSERTQQQATENLNKNIIENIIENKQSNNEQLMKEGRITGQDATKNEEKIIDIELNKNNNLENELTTDSKTEDLEDLKEIITKRFSINPRESTTEDIDRTLSELKKAISLSNNILNNNEGLLSPKENQNLHELMELINKNIDFSSQMKSVVFFQIPFLIDNKKTDTELFVFKDKRKKSNKSSSSSALLSLDTLSLGHIEAYIQKNKNSITCQFRLQNPVMEDVVKGNIQKLNAKLAQFGYSLENVMYKAIKEPFSLTDEEPKIEPQINNDDTNNNKGNYKLFVDVKV